jgi:hypothetical protein
VWLVDGNNVMGARADGWWKDRAGAMQRLVDDLDRLDEDVHVIFDGRDRGLTAERATVSFAPHADDAIAERAAPGVTVVTSDRELRRRAEAKGAEVVGVRALLDRL